MKNLHLKMLNLAAYMEAASDRLIMDDDREKLLYGWELKSMAEMLRNLTRGDKTPVKGEFSMFAD